MTTIASIAQRILDENNYTTSDISLTNLEYIIDNVIDDVNAEAGTTIADLSGSAASKSITGTDTEILTVKMGTIIMLRGYKDRGPNVGVGGLSVTTGVSDPQYDFYSKRYHQLVQRLKEPPIYIENDPVPTSE